MSGGRESHDDSNEASGRRIGNIRVLPTHGNAHGFGIGSAGAGIGRTWSADVGRF